MSLKIAILDLYNGTPNQGMRGIQEILKRYSKKNQLALEYHIFDVRGKCHVPGTNYDIYISSGGPGSPFDGEDSEWEKQYFKLIDQLEAINNNPERTDKKYLFAICHSFQMLCRKYKLGTVTKRRSTSFGIFPVNKTEAGHSEEILSGVGEPFYAVDSRDWQVIEPNEKQFAKIGATLLALEKDRPHVNLERCMMAIRFNEYFFGTQFHPEAAPVGMRQHLLNEEKKNQIIEIHGQEKYDEMMAFLEDPEILERTQNQIIPSFLNQAITSTQLA